MLPCYFWVVNDFCDDACCMFALYKVCVLVGSECVSFITFYDVRLRDRRVWWSSPLPFLFYPRPGPLPEPRQAIQMLADNNTYHYLSCMFYFWSFTKTWLSKTIFDVANTTILVYRLPLCQ